MSDKNKNPVLRQEWEIDALRAVDSGLVADVVSDFRRPISRSHSLIPESQREPEIDHRPASGGTIPLATYSHINIIDQICDADARRDYIARLRQEAENRWIEQKLERRDPFRARTAYDPLDGFDDDVPSCHRDK
jgi:hypothetical protein